MVTRWLHPLYKGWISFSALIDGSDSITVGNWLTAMIYRCNQPSMQHKLR
ncbi:hypothetical protein yberc0001_12270 [Yersinia bercovieri ATCC 43970]|uniref:Uncharacterized protein n=1 Tax=Yersinia bercovieri ATCC 43970 TaxID=349968 RepID=A0ABM9XZV6_YERBE|nr:hypothetical protein yberc0001_12270 [Yersinia bercovieri ATCC 43970]